MLGFKKRLKGFNMFNVFARVQSRERGRESRAAHADNAPVEFCFTKLLRRIRSAIAKTHRFAVTDFTHLCLCFAQQAHCAKLRCTHVGFTLAEAILTMTILGIIAVVMIGIIKPSKYRGQTMLTLKQRVYVSVDQAILNIMQDCSDDLNLIHTRISCDKGQNLISDTSNIYISLLPLFLKGTVGACDSATFEYESGTNITIPNSKSFKMKNGVCLYLNNLSNIYVDVNGKEGPNDASDRFIIRIDQTQGVTTDMPTTFIKDYACNIIGCAECADLKCTKCYCGYALTSSGGCKTTSNNESQIPGPGCHYAKLISSVYTDSSCNDSSIVHQYCYECATEVLTSVPLYKWANGECKETGTNMVTCAASAECEPI